MKKTKCTEEQKYKRMESITGKSHQFHLTIHSCFSMRTKEGKNISLVLDILGNQFENMKIKKQSYKSSGGVHRLLKT